MAAVDVECMRRDQCPCNPLKMPVWSHLQMLRVSYIFAGLPHALLAFTNSNQAIIEPTHDWQWAESLPQCGACNIDSHPCATSNIDSHLVPASSNFHAPIPPAMFLIAGFNGSVSAMLCSNWVRISILRPCLIGTYDSMKIATTVDESTRKKTKL